MVKLDVEDCVKCDKNEACCSGCFRHEEYSIFKGLAEDELSYLIEDKCQIHYNPGETIIKQNTSSSYVVCVRDGLAKIYVEGINGKNLIVKLVGKLDFVTGGGLFNGNVHHFTISAITHVTCCLIDSSKLAKLFSENNSFALELLRYHTKQNNNLLNKLVNLTQKYMPGRVADTLLYLKDDIYKSNSFVVPLTRQELADLSNMTKESLVRILQQFKTSELIEVQGNKFTILDENGLMSVSKNG